MQLECWNEEPAPLRLLAVHRGTEDGYRSFLLHWQEWGGRFDLQAAKVTGPHLQPFTHGNGDAAILWLGEPPSDLLRVWCLRQSEWRVFWLWETLEPDWRGDGKVPEPGHYLPWGMGLGSPAPATQHAVLVADSGHRLDLSQACVFQPVFDQSHDQAVVVGRKGPIRQASGLRAGAADPPPHPLLLRLVATRPDERPDRITERLQKVNAELEQLTAQRDMLHAWTDCDDLPVRLRVYPELDDPGGMYGSLTTLRRWFLRAPEAALGEYVHARVVLDDGIEEGHQGPFALHLVLPRDYVQPPEHPLPSAAYELALDPFWYRRCKQRLFTPVGTRLWPPPPVEDTHARAVMSAELWHGREHDSAVVVLSSRPHGDGAPREVRFLSGPFHPLDAQVAELNLAVNLREGAITARPTPEESFRHAADAVVERFRHVHEAAAEAIATSLGAIWGQLRGELETYRDRAAEAERTAVAITRLVGEIDAIRAAELRDWSAFRNTVLRLDREVVDAQLSGLNALDEARGALVDLLLTAPSDGDPVALQRQVAERRAAVVVAAQQAGAQPIDHAAERFLELLQEREALSITRAQPEPQSGEDRPEKERP